MLKDLFSAVQKSLSDRVRDPLLGSYSIFFLIWNWKPIALVLFGSFGGFEDRVRYVQELYHFPKADLWGEYGPFWGCPGHFGAWCWSLLWNYGAPLLWTAVYLTVYPIFKRAVVVYWQKQETKTINAKREEEKTIALTPATSARLQGNLDRLQSELEKAKRERFNLPELQRLACEGAAKLYGGESSQFAIAFANIADKDTVRPGHWMVLDGSTSEVFYYEGQWKPQWGVCMVTHLLDGLLVMVRRSGTVRWDNWPGIPEMTLTAMRPYILSRKPKGALRQPQKTDPRVDRSLIERAGKATRGVQDGGENGSKGEDFRGFVGYATVDGNAITIARDNSGQVASG